MSQTASTMFDQMRFAVCPHCRLQIVCTSVGVTAAEVWHEKCWRAISETIGSALETPFRAARELTSEPIVVSEPIEMAVREARALPSVPFREAREQPSQPIEIAFGEAYQLPSAPPRRLSRRVMFASAGAMALAITGWFATAPAAGSPPSIELAASEHVVWMDMVVRAEIPNAAVDPLVIHKIPTMRGTPTVELFPSLATWIHPVVNTDLTLPLLSSGGFGAERDGVMRRECGHGHCGNDINGPIGRPIVAVADGIVDHVDWSRQGADKRSGRYVKLEHADGTFTAYMHLNSIVAGLERGDRVVAGQQIGTLGRTGIKSAPPHLHFALAVPNASGKSTRYIDPAPYLVRAKVLAAPDRRRPDKPAW